MTLDKRDRESKDMKSEPIADFTEGSYDKLLLKAKKKFIFVVPGEQKVITSSDPLCIWRHDVDVSPHRAFHLAKREADLGINCIYYIMLSSRFYNVFEPSVTSIIVKISQMGHHIGLHFDASRYLNYNLEKMVEKLHWEAQTLSELTGANVNSFSLHDPTSLQGSELLKFNSKKIFNASLNSYVSGFTYCSDSNGLWRHRNLHDVIDDDSVRRLYALTHPEWWTSNPESPRRRIQRAIDGRAMQCSKEYDKGMALIGRPNY